MIAVMPPGAAVTQRLQSAGIRALESQSRLKRLADALVEELEEVTASHARVSLSPEDSVVIEIDRAIAIARR